MIILNNRLEIAKEFAEAIKSDKIVKIILFGSVARGEDREYSDIDILIVSDYRDDIWEDIADIIGEIVLNNQELISVHIMNTNRFNTAQNYSFLSNVLKDGIILFIMQMLRIKVKVPMPIVRTIIKKKKMTRKKIMF